MIHDSISDCIGSTPLVRLNQLFPDAQHEILAKLEFLNPGGSIKDRPARFIIEGLLESGAIDATTTLVESSSGNFGIALAMVAKHHGLKFICVVDRNISAQNLKILHKLGAIVEIVEEADGHGGYLQTRIKRVGKILEEVPNSYWTNQYANKLNCLAHERGTAEEIIADIGRHADIFICAVSTTGTIHGVSRRLRQHIPGLRTVAVDAAGSVIFRRSSGPRLIPGHGASRVPELLNLEEIDEVIHVTDLDAVQGCHVLLEREGILAGGSSGAVVSALERLLPRLAAPARIITILPDRGERYLDTIYDEVWVERWLKAPVR